MIVDDSAIVLRTFQEILDSDPGIEVMGVASEPFAVTKMNAEIPDVITSDLGMPRMEGFTFLQKIMSHPNLCVDVLQLDRKRYRN
nr:response regulator [Malonomonas rubra]